MWWKELPSLWYRSHLPDCFCYCKTRIFFKTFLPAVWWVLVQIIAKKLCSNCGNLGSWHNFTLWIMLPGFDPVCESVALLWLWSSVCTLQWLPNLLITIVLCPYNVWTLKGHALWHGWFPPHAEGMMPKDRNIPSCRAVMPPSYVSCERVVSGYPKVHTPAAQCLSCWDSPCAITQTQWFTATDVQVVQCNSTCF